MFRWLPEKLPIPAAGLLRYGSRLMLEADLWGRPAAESSRRNDLIDGLSSRRIDESATFHSSISLWSEECRVEPMLVPLDLPFTEFIKPNLKLFIFRDVLQSMTLLDRLMPWLDDPGKTSRLGYWACVKASKRNGIQSDEFNRALALLAIGSLGTQLLQRCEKCFRKAIPSLKRCAVHSQSHGAWSEDVESENKRRVNTRTAELIMAELGDLGQAKDIPAAKLSRASALHGAVFDKPLGSVEDWMVAMSLALNKARAVPDLPPADFKISETAYVLATLRRVVDPLERDPWAWPKKIVLAGRWIPLQTIHAPGSPPTGPQPKTLARLARVNELRSQGMNDEQIAVEIDMSVRALKLMLTRHTPGNLPS
jgi:hypothetical protein